MFFISHRGNLKGPNKDEENKIEYIDKALKKNFDVEIDLWFVKKNFFLGHDEPLYKVDRKYLKNKKFWIHAKNLDCFYELNNSKLNYFWHESDKVIFGITLVQNLIEIKVFTFFQSVQKNLTTL